jgi:hypothetical protein
MSIVSRKISFAVSFLILQSVAWATPVKDKFLDLSSKISSEMTNYGDNPSRIDSMSSGSLRQYLFTIQTMADLYSQRYPELSEIRVSSKEFEDEIGSYRKTVEQLEYAKNAGASASRIQRLADANESEKRSLVRFIDSRGWAGVDDGQPHRIKSIIKKINWQSEKSDQQYTYSALAHQVKVIDQTHWDMGRLEGGGIHDLRKAVRWYKLEVAALSDVVATQNNTCGDGAVLPSDPRGGGKCLISDCLNKQMNRIYDTFGAIKDAGEGQEGVGGDVPAGKLREAADLYREVKDKKVFEKLSGEFSQCAKD